jgi:hypothetical protein
MGGPSVLIKLNPKGLVETVMVTVILIAIVDLAMTVAVTMVVVGVHHMVVVVAAIASSVGNLVILLESALLGMVGEEIDMVVEMIGMVVGVVMDQTVVVTDTLAAAVMVVTVATLVVIVTAVTDLVPTDGLDLKKYVPSRYGSLSIKVCYRVAGSL